MTIDDDLRHQLAAATDLTDDIQVRFGAAGEIRRAGDRRIRRRRIAGASAAVAFVALSAVGAGLLGTRHDDRGAPPAVQLPAPVRATATRFVQPLRVDAIVSQHAGICRANELPAVDGSACYRLAGSGGLSITKVTEATLYPPYKTPGTVPGTPMGQEIAIQLTARDARVLSALTARAIDKQVAISLNDQVIEAPQILSQLVNGQFSVSGEYGFMPWVWLQLTGHLPTGAKPGLPPATASPEQVVRAYVAAINRHDLATVTALLTPQEASNFNSDDGFSNIISMSKLSISPPRNQPPSYAASRGYRQVVQVPVDFRLRQHREESRPDGQTPWGYLLARNSDSQPWRILDEGVA